MSIRLQESENLRFWKLMDAAKKKNPYLDKSHVIRELLGLAPLNILTAADLRYFQTGEKNAGIPKNTMPGGALKFSSDKDEDRDKDKAVNE